MIKNVIRVKRFDSDLVYGDMPRVTQLDNIYHDIKQRYSRCADELKEMDVEAYINYLKEMFEIISLYDIKYCQIALEQTPVESRPLYCITSDDIANVEPLIIVYPDCVDLFYACLDACSKIGCGLNYGPDLFIFKVSGVVPEHWTIKRHSYTDKFLNLISTEFVRE